MSKTLTVIGHRANLLRELRRVWDDIHASEEAIEWVIEASNDPRDGVLTIRFEQEFEDVDDPTIVWDLSDD